MIFLHFIVGMLGQSVALIENRIANPLKVATGHERLLVGLIPSLDQSRLLFVD